MSENINESKRHYIADEELGGVEREYVETDRKADVGDYIVGNSGTIYQVDNIGSSGTVFGEISAIARKDQYTTLYPTDIIHHNGERYRLVSDRKAKVCDKVIVTATNLGNMRDVKIGGVYETITRDLDGSPVVIDDASDKAAMQYGNFHVLEPVIDDCSDKTEGGQSIQQQYREYAERKAIAESQPDSTPDLIDLVIRLTRKVAELEKRVGKEESLAIKAHHKAYNNRLDVEELYNKVAELEKDTDVAIDGAANALSAANIADYKAGQALTTSELHATHIETLSSDVISLSKRRYCR